LSKLITLAHGSGGVLTHELIKNIFIKYFSNEYLEQGDDAAKLQFGIGNLAFTTDSYVITPIFFNGGDIGKLSVCGTINDISTAGAEPKVLSCSFIIEEGFEIDELVKIVESMANTARLSKVKIVTGDTKVVQKGACDKIFINTAGIGLIPEGIDISCDKATVDDSIIITGTIGDHGATILLQRENLYLNSDLRSDCAPLNDVVKSVMAVTNKIHVLRDPTRGGLATSLNEIAERSNVCIELYEEKIPIKDNVRGVCELLGLDPLYMANEGKMIIIVPRVYENYIIDVLRKNDLAKDAAIIGHVTDYSPKKVLLKTISGGRRIIGMHTGEQLPRIC